MTVDAWRRTPARWLTGGRFDWLLLGILVGPAVAYLALRQPLLGVALLSLSAVPIALSRADLIVLSLIPLTVVSTVLAVGSMAVVVATALLAVAMLLARRQADSVRLGWPAAAAALLGVLLVASVFQGQRGTWSGSALQNLAGFLTGLVIMTAASALPARPVAVARIIVLAGSAAAVHTLLFGFYVSGRVVGIGLYHNYLAAFLAVPIAVGVALARYGTGRARIGWLGLVGLCLLALIQTHSRGGMIAAVAGVSIAMIVGRPVRQRIGVAVLTVLAAVAVVTTGNPFKDAVIGTRSSAELEINTAIRAGAAKLAAQLAVEHPFRGIGYGRFAGLAYVDPRLGVYMNTHNDYLRLAAEAGVATLLVFLALLGAGLLTRVPVEFVPLRAAVAAGATSLLFANTLANLTVSGMFWISLGCVLAGRLRGTDHRHTITQEELIRA